MAVIVRQLERGELWHDCAGQVDFIVELTVKDRSSRQ